jgi:Rrf2 family transcriptional regulator, nitric oxide-sensitive transcriptional repressor
MENRTLRVANYSDFALRLLMYAAIKHPNYVTITEVANAYGISKNHLMKVTHELALAGYLDTLRGRNGGLRLARPAREINVGKVMRLTEKGSALVECFDPATNRCVITPACALRHVLRDALEAFFLRLEETTLADLVRKPKDLTALFPANAP